MTEKSTAYKDQPDAFKVWVEDTTRLLVGDLLADIFGEQAPTLEALEAVRKLSHRIAIGIVQARGKECRAIFGMLAKETSPNTLLPASQVIMVCDGRGQFMEHIGLDMANNPWPPARLELVQ